MCNRIKQTIGKTCGTDSPLSVEQYSMGWGLVLKGIGNERNERERLQCKSADT
jgi:hypothetical protein